MSLNTWAMCHKGRERVVKLAAQCGPEGSVRNATIDLFAIDDRQKPDKPAVGIIRFTGRECYARHHFLRQDGFLHSCASGLYGNT